MKAVSQWNALLIGSLVVFVLALAFLIAVPAPTRSQVGIKTRATTSANALAVKSAEALYSNEKEVESKLWKLTPETLGSRILTDVTKLAARRQLQVSRFSVGKPVEVAGLLEARYFVALDGQFLSILAAIRELEDPKSNLVVSEIKLGSTEGIDRVSCLVTLAGFIQGEAH